MAAASALLALFIVAYSFGRTTATQENGAYCECCENYLFSGQFFCVDPVIDPASQAERDCDPDTQTVNVTCYPVPRVNCTAPNGSSIAPPTDSYFNRTRGCRFVQGQRYNYFVAVTLSLFLGILGVDRFYLGYPALGLVKLCTVGFLFVGYIFDFLLIAMQVVGPADQSGYYAPYYGPLLTRVR